jgi:hypothetical protein
MEHRDHQDHKVSWTMGPQGPVGPVNPAGETVAVVGSFAAKPPSALPINGFF